MKKRSVIVVILFIMNIIAIPCANITIAAQTTVNMGDISIQDGSHAFAKMNPTIIVRPSGNTITVQVTYSMICNGLADDGYCDISFVGSEISDSRHTGSSDSGTMTISKYMNPGESYQVKLHAKYTDYYGASTIFDDSEYISGTVQVAVSPVAGFSFSPSNPTTDDIIQFTDLSTITNTVIVQWSWSFGDGTSSTERNPQHKYQNSGTYTATLQVTDDYGFTPSQIKTISVKRHPIASFSYSPIAPTTDDTVYFKDLSYDPDGTIISWSWVFGDGYTSDSQNTTHQYQNYGTYTVSLHVSDNDGFIDVRSIEIIVKKKPTAQFSFLPSSPKLADTIQFSDLSSSYNSTITSWSWNFGDGTTSTEKNPTHKYQRYGTYSVTLEVTDSNGLKRSKTVSISNENNAPVASFTYLPSEPTTDNAIQFTDSSYDTDGNVVSWSWDFGDSSSSTEKNPTHQYSTSGTFSVKLQVSDNEGTSNTKTTSITIKEKSIPGFEIIILFCAIFLVIMLFKRRRK